MKTRVMVQSLVLAALVFSLAAGATAGPDAPQTIPIGAALSLTGRLSNLGNQCKAGYELAVEEINRGGGVFVKEYGKKIPLELVVQDSESDQRKVVSMMEWLYSSKKVIAYVGEGLMVNGQGVAEKNKVAAVAIAQPHQSPHERGLKYWFAACPKASDMGRNICDVLDTVPPQERPKTIAIFQEQTEAGVENAEAYRK